MGCAWLSAERTGKYTGQLAAPTGAAPMPTMDRCVAVAGAAGSCTKVGVILRSDFAEPLWAFATV